MLSNSANGAGGQELCFAVNQANKTAIDKQLSLFPKGELPLVGWSPRRWMNGFSHPSMPIVLNDGSVALAQWGLIPAWTEDEAEARLRQNQTLNARSDTIYELPSFAASASNKRCVIPINGFFEHQHRSRNGTPDPYGDRTQPFLVSRREQPAMFLGGLWELWRGMLTFTVVMTEANQLMAEIHNAENKHRMPVVIPDEEIHNWLRGGGKEVTAPFFLPREDLGLVAVETRGMNETQLSLFQGDN